MTLIAETDHFIVETADRPHIDRLDGGHIRIVPKKRVEDRSKLSLNAAHEMVVLSMVVGEAMQVALSERGIDVARINYQENGNWGALRPEGPYLHLHLYGRARSAVKQPFGEALYLPSKKTGYYDGFEALNTGDVEAIRAAVPSLICQEKYRGELTLRFPDLE